ncbi:MAG: hypothetical protein A2161_22145 [Candidatus Schekmanbacteria bacterium RBG_13_48_7]|uniref:Uncharacterized protein n=1 Tax=Candidatus Schekmanbacteria bacterium RBG_13_48_7 TaxID=1817878 RepID=A0A1F7S0A7_9BACT|nr:MAG: hypothetical protein A2161_22145 [Candidatus Schekmanbacteria bacterium RBG_13_48_7]
MPVYLPHQSEKQYDCLLYIASFLYNTHITLAKNSKEILKSDFKIKTTYESESLHIGITSKDQSAFLFIRTLSYSFSGRKVEPSLFYLNPDIIPDSWIGLDAVDVIILED